MVTAMVITLREGMEAALVLGIILTYLRRTGRGYLARYVFLGLALAIAVSVAAAIFVQAMGLDPENEVLEGTLLGLGAIFVTSMVVWMWRASRNIGHEMEMRMEALSDGGAGWRAGLGFLAFTLFMVAREGLETVIFLAALTLGGASLMDALGAFLGLGLAALFAVLFIQGSLRLRLGRFLNVTSVVLLALALRLLAGSVHEFAEVGLLPMSAEVMAVLGYFVRDQASDVLFMALVAMPIALLLWDFLSAPSPVAPPGESAAQSRQRRAARRGELLWQLSLGAATALILVSMTSQVLAASPFIDPIPEPISSAQGEVSLLTAGWAPNVLKKFTFTSAQGQARFLAVKLEDGVVLSARDACQICGAAGYMQEREGPNAICKNCNAPIPMHTLGMGGGCNPLPLASRQEGDTLIIPVNELLR